MTTTVTRQASAYEITVDGVRAGVADFVEKEGVVVFTHTVVEPAFGGQGIGGQLAQGALDDVRSRGLRAVPRCEFIKGWIDKHPEYRDLVQGADRSDGQA